MHHIMSIQLEHYFVLCLWQSLPPKHCLISAKGRINNMIFSKSKSALLFLSIGLLLGCSPKDTTPPPASKLQLELQGSHLLRQIGTKTITNTSSDASYFLFIGSASQSSTQVAMVTFSWLDNTGVYRFLTLPLDKVRIKLDDNVATPYVRFKWTDWDNPESAKADNIIYVLVFCNSKDWPEDIKIPTATN